MLVFPIWLSLSRLLSAARRTCEEQWTKLRISSQAQLDLTRCPRTLLENRLARTQKPGSLGPDPSPLRNREEECREFRRWV
jgi:hypothetical protein